MIHKEVKKEAPLQQNICVAPGYAAEVGLRSCIIPALTGIFNLGTKSSEITYSPNVHHYVPSKHMYSV